MCGGVPVRGRVVENRRPFEPDVSLRYRTSQDGGDPDFPQDKSVPSVRSRKVEWSRAWAGECLHPVFVSLFEGLGNGAGRVLFDVPVRSRRDSDVVEAFLGRVTTGFTDSRTNNW